MEKCLSPFPPFSVFRLFGSEKDSKSMSDLFLPEDVRSAADNVMGDDNPDDGSCLSDWRAVRVRLRPLLPRHCF